MLTLFKHLLTENRMFSSAFELLASVVLNLDSSLYFNFTGSVVQMICNCLQTFKAKQDMGNVVFGRSQFTVGVLTWLSMLVLKDGATAVVTAFNGLQPGLLLMVLKSELVER